MDFAESLRKDHDSTKRDFVSAKSKYDMFVFANGVHHYYVSNVVSSEERVAVEVDIIRASLDDVDSRKSNYLSDEERKLFLNYLDEYFGLRMTTEKEAGFRNNPNLKPGDFLALSGSRSGV